MNLTRISEAWLKVTESFSVSPTDSGESIGWEFKYKNFFLWKERSSLISLILNSK